MSRVWRACVRHRSTATKIRTSPAQQQQQLLRFSFSGAGFLGVWHLGVGDVLRRAGVISHEHDNVQIAGASAGAIVGAILITGTPISQARIILDELVTRTREIGALGVLTPGYSLVDSVREAMAMHLPHDAHQMASGRLHVALTSLGGDNYGRTYHRSSFGSRDELIDSVAASSDIPGVTSSFRAAAALRSSEPTLTQRMLRRDDIDGGIWDLFPDPWNESTHAPPPLSPPPAREAAHAAAADAAGVDATRSSSSGSNSSTTPPPPPVIFVSPFLGTGFAISPGHDERAPMIPAWSPIAASKNGRTIDLTPANMTRWRHAFMPPDLDTLQNYEDEARRQAEAWLVANGWGESESK